MHKHITGSLALNNSTDDLTTPEECATIYELKYIKQYTKERHMK